MDFDTEPSRPNYFILPNNPACRVSDRFSILEGGEEDAQGAVLYWPLLFRILDREVGEWNTFRIVDLLQEIAAITGNSTACDYMILKELLARENDKGLQPIDWPNIFDIALDLPTYFPHGKIDLLEPNSVISLSRGQVACLVAHQFLCSSVPQRNDEGYQDFGIWFAANQRHPEAVRMYLTAVLNYFRSLPAARALKERHNNPRGDPNAQEESPDNVRFRLHRNRRDVTSEINEMRHVNFVYVEKHSTTSVLPEFQGANGAAVVASNKIIGFGQSATQEEIFIGITPEACPAVLFAPHLTDEDAMTISGARAMIHADGERRDLHWSPRRGPSHSNVDEWLAQWAGGNLILMDALEMDMVEETDDLPDLNSDNVNREIKKAYVGFNSKQYRPVTTGLWGCGAFCGDPAVKLIIMWIAASQAKIDLKIVFNQEQRKVGRVFESLVRRCDHLDTWKLRELLCRAPKNLRSLDLVEWLRGVI